MWPGGNVLRCRRHAHENTRRSSAAARRVDALLRHGIEQPCGSASQRRRLAVSPPQRPSHDKPHRLSSNRTVGKETPAYEPWALSLWAICRKLDCEGVSRPGPGKVASGGPGCSRYNRQSALPPCGREGLVLGRLAAFGAGGHTRTVAAVRALAARTGETTESAKPCTPRWRQPRARSTSSCCLAWWTRQTRPRHRRPSLSPL